MGVIDQEKLNEVVALVARRAVFKTICFESLAKDIVEHILSAMTLKALKVRAIEKILRNMTLVSKLEQLMVWIVVMTCMCEGEDNSF
jgi:hypothetical protein